MDQEVPIESAATDSSETQALFKLWQIIRRRKWRIALGVVVGLAAAIGFHQLTGPWYESTAQLLVIKRHPDTTNTLEARGAVPDEEYLPTHMLVITSLEIVRQAVVDKELKSLAIFQGQSLLGRISNSVSRLVFPDQPEEGSREDAVTKAIISSLVVSSASPKPGEPPSRQVFYLSFRGKVSQDCKEVLNAVTASYQRFWRQVSKDRYDVTLRVLRRQKETLWNDLKSKEDQHVKFAQKAPVQRKAKDGTTAPEERLIDLDTRKTRLLVRQAEIKATLTVIKIAQEKGLSYASILEVLTPSQLTDPEPNPPLRPQISPAQELLNLLFREKTLTVTEGENSRKVREVREQIETFKRMLTPSPAAADKDPKQDAWAQDFVRMHIQALTHELDLKQRLVEKLDSLIQGNEKEATAARIHELQEELYKDGIKSTRLLYDTVEQRIKEIESQDVGGYDTYIIAAPEAGKWYLKKYLLVLALALFTGLLGGVGWAYRAEVADKRFRTSEEIGQRLGLPVLGHIPVLPEGARALHQVEPKQTVMDTVLCTHYRSSSPGAEAYRTLRTALYFSKHTQGHQIIQITSPESGAGKTTLAANLAVSIAQSGKRTLLIDADFRRPRLHTIYGMPNQVGFTTLLAGQAQLPEAIQESGVLGLSVLTSGPIPPNPSELLSSPRLKELFDSLRQQYDFVLVDTPPLLAVTDPCVVASRVDGVVLTIGNSKNSRPAARRARAILDTIGANVLGVVVNGVRRCHAAGNYVY